MNQKGLAIWIASLIVMITAVIPFIYFMFNPRSTTLYITIAAVATGAILHVIARKMLTHKNGYTVFQARQFYNQCLDCGLTSLKECKLNADKAVEIAQNYDFSKNLQKKDIFEMYTIGYDFCNRKKG